MLIGFFLEFISFNQNIPNDNKPKQNSINSNNKELAIKPIPSESKFDDEDDFVELKSKIGALNEKN